MRSKLRAGLVALAMAMTPLATVVALVTVTAAPAAANTYYREYEARNWQDHLDGTGTDQTWTRVIGDDGGSTWVEEDWWCEAENYWVMRNRPYQDPNTGHWEENWVWVLEGTGPC